MELPGRGYDLPFPVEKGARVGQMIVVSVVVLLWTAYGLWETIQSPEGWVLLVPVPLMLLLIMNPCTELLARLHLVPEGIAITLFGKTIRRLPAESIRFLGAVTGNKNNERQPKIAVCCASLEELTALGEKHIPRWIRTEHEVWPGEFAGKYLNMRGTMTLSGEMNLQRKILWLDWSPERLQLLRELYPDARWLDCTRDKMFEKQLQNK